MDAQKFIDDVTAESFETYSVEVSLADLKKDAAKHFNH